MKNIMIDLETLGTKPGSIIVSIGAVKFNETDIGDTFYEAIDIDSSQANGFQFSGKTIQWWMDQSDEARAVFDQGSDVMVVLDALRDFFDHDEYRVWGNGSTFDNVLLTEAYHLCGWEAPWKYWHNMCYRTVKYMNPDIVRVDSGIRHNALDDAINQVRHLQTIIASNNKIQLAA